MTDDRQRGFVRHGVGTVRPYIFGHLDLASFVQDAFHATELERLSSGGGFHVEVQIGDSVIMMELGGNALRVGSPSAIYVFAPDVDAAYERAIQAGATSINAPEDKPYQERAAGVKDSVDPPVRARHAMSMTENSRQDNAGAQLSRTAPFASLTYMPRSVAEHVGRTIETLYRSESGVVLATLLRLLGDLDLAEEAMHEAFAAALEAWPRTGLPAKPRPWLISTARFKAIDGMRRRARFDRTQRDLAAAIEARISDAPLDEEEIEDDRLRLIFTCCHPALPPEGQVALTLREICGLTTEDIARAFLVSPATLAQRVVRAKAVIRAKAIPYQVPASHELSARLGAVLQAVYLIFNQGYSTDDAGAAALTCEAIRLGRVLIDLIEEPEVAGLLGLMLLQESRRAARTSPDGDVILLEQQDRSLWDRGQIAEGLSLTERALASHRFGAYTLQAAIAAVHAESISADSTDWRQITLLYDRLLHVQPSPVVELNRAVAVAMSEGPEQGLSLIDDLLARGQLADYYLAHAARADLCRRLGRLAEARMSYERALALVQRDPERRYLTRRLTELP